MLLLQGGVNACSITKQHGNARVFSFYSPFVKWLEQRRNFTASDCVNRIALCRLCSKLQFYHIEIHFTGFMGPRYLKIEQYGGYRVYIYRVWCTGGQFVFIFSSIFEDGLCPLINNKQVAFQNLSILTFKHL